MATNCDCYSEFDRLCQVKTGDAKGFIDWICRPFEEGSPTYPRLRFLYHKVRKDGTREKKESEESIIPSFCPFCGKSYTLGECNDTKPADDN